jgi:N-ethylmaleimide reductase
MNNKNSLFTEYKLNHLLTLKNKILMAPMTRAKADNDLVPTQAMAEYYARRADAGLIITEGTIISPDALGYSNVPGIFNEAQINKWKAVTDAVHKNNGLIFMQIWHVGRVSHPHFLNGKLPVSASKTTMTSRISRSEGLTYGESRALTLQEIKELINRYAMAAKNAIKAGFDGVEIHGANGYLIDQFLHYHTNKRDDEYGGNPLNMARFALEIVKACGEAIGYERVGLRLSPGAYLNEIVGEKRDALVFKYLFEKLNDYPLAYVHTGNFNDAQQFEELDNMTMTDFIRFHYHGTVIAAGGYTIEMASAGVSRGSFNLVALGRPFISNPDLIIRLRKNDSVIRYDSSMLSTLY